MHRTVTTSRIVSAGLAGVAIVFGLAVASYAYLGSFSRYLADDYCTAAILEAEGFFGSQSYWYTMWTGRFGYTFAMNVVELFGVGAAPILPALLLLTWLVVLTWVVSQISGMLAGQSRSIMVSLAFATVMLFHLVHTLPDIGMTLYWQTGSVNYLIPLILTCLLVGMASRWATQPGTLTHRELATFGLIAVLIPGFNETHTIVQLGAFAVILASLILLSDRAVIRRFLPLVGVGLFSTVLGFLIVYVAPGNEARRALSPEPGPWPEVLRVSLDGTNRFLIGYVNYQRATLATAVVIAIIAWASYTHTAQKLPHPTARQSMLFLLISANCLYAVVVLCYLPSKYLLGNVSPRSMATAAFAVTLLLALWSLLLGYWLARWSGACSAWISQRVLLVMGALALVLAMWSGPLHIAELALADRSDFSAYARAWDQRHDYLLSQSGVNTGNVEIAAIGNRVIPVDVTVDPAHWINDCMARYYDVDSVTADESRP